MTAGLALDAGLAVLVLAVASWTIAAGTAFAAVIGFVTYGLLLSLVWVRLAAVDVALTEAAIGSGVTGVVLLSAATGLRPTEALSATERPSATLRLVAAALCALVVAGLATLVLMPPGPAPTLAPLAVAHLPEFGLSNPVTGVLMVYRAVDTLLECVALVLALLGVWSLAPDRFWGGIPGTDKRLQQYGPLTFLARVLVPVGVVIGIYIFWIGSSRPGGEFQGATILAAMWILVMMAGLRDPPAIRGVWLRLVFIGGPVIFLAVGFAGFALAGGFLAYPAGYAKLLILGIEVPLTVSIAAMLGLLVAGPPQRKQPL
jgi:multisubunit Na+/H+ antiporter MnhB subunit